MIREFTDGTEKKLPEIKVISPMYHDEYATSRMTPDLAKAPWVYCRTISAV